MEFPRLRVISVQNNPISDLEENKLEVRALVENFSGKKLDLIVFPELALTGWPTVDTIEFLAEKAGEGENFKFFSHIAALYKCYVCAGYPEKDGSVYYNSLYCIDRAGKLVKNYRQHTLTEMQKTIFQAGDNFEVFELVTLEKKTLTVAPCLACDIKPKSMSDFKIFEFAEFARQKEADLVVVCCNWPTSEKLYSSEKVIEYLVMRMTPLVNNGLIKMTFGCKFSNDYKNWIMVVANRVGSEGDKSFSGGSCHIVFQPAQVMNKLDQNENKALYSKLGENSLFDD